jgi:hypothetical protein
MLTRRLIDVVLVALVLLVPAAVAQTITVTTCDDEIDIPYWTGTLADLPGPDGLVSFPEALLVSDNEPGRQTIAFNIPPSEWWLPNIFPGQVMLYSMLGWSCSDSVIIDGTTQTAFTGDTFPDGNELSMDGLQLVLGGDDSIITGFHSDDFIITGSNCEVYGNTGSNYFTLYGGSGSYIHDNEAWTIKIDQSNDNVVVRNVTERVRVWGWMNGNQPALNNRIGGPDPADRNFITGFGNYGEHGVPAGTTVQISDTIGTLIQNNYIGTTPDGMAIGNQASTEGIGIMNQNRDLVIRDNLIAASALGVYPASGVPFGQAIYIQAYDGDVGGFTDNVQIYNNTLGLNALGEPVLGGVYGVSVATYAQDASFDVRIGGPEPGQGNVIAGHLENGVIMQIAPGVPPGPGTGIRVSGNSIYYNGALDIELMPNTWTLGPTPNDPLDADVGANGLQNFPELVSAERQGSSVHVVGTLSSSPLDDFTVEFFASPACDPSGFGPGETFLGSTSVTTDAAGNASFDVTLPASVAVGAVVTATATIEPAGQTSEFSECVPVSDGGVWANLGGGTVGIGGQPQLAMSGPLTPASTLALDLVDGAPSALAIVFISTASTPSPFLGGTLHAVPVDLLVITGTDAGGELHASGPFPGAAAGAQMWFQVALEDASVAGFGACLSNAMQGTVP